MTNYNILTGSVKAVQSTPLSADELANFRAYFTTLVEKKRNIDPEIAESWAKEYDFYAYCATVAKASFTSNNLPFIPQECTSGTFGCREILPVDFGTIAAWVAPVTSTFHSWSQSLTAAAANGWTDLFGTLVAPITPSNTQSYHSLLAFHGLISWQPGTRALAIKHTVNSYTYPGVSVEEAAKIDKPFKTFKLIPLEAEFMVAPTSSFNTRIELEKVVFANAETYTEQLAPLGLTFAEYGYLNAEIN